MSEDQGAGPAGVEQAHARLLADDGIQFDFPAQQPPAEVPDWMRGLGKFLSDHFGVLEIGFWIVVGVLAAGLAGVLFVRFSGIEFPWRRRREDEAAEEWRPAEAPARALLREADALAGEGRYSDAAHLLLFRSIEEIEKRRPRLLRPALTSRDIAQAPELPAGPRSAFASIAMAVERSLFGGRSLDERDWLECRAAYEDFALARAWR